VTGYSENSGPYPVPVNTTDRPSAEAQEWALTVPGWAWVISENLGHLSHALQTALRRLHAAGVGEDVKAAVSGPLREAVNDASRCWFLALGLNQEAAVIYPDGSPAPMTRYRHPYSPVDLEAATTRLLAGNGPTDLTPESP
jgi:hypothetical protein